MSKLADAAATLAARGWPIFPITPRGKNPLTQHGLKDATTDSRIVTEWWKRWSDANVGYVTGERIVVDVDGPMGEVALKELEKIHGKLPQTLEAKTGRGRHLYFESNGTPIRNSAGKLGQHLDIRGEGGYVILPPSIHENGTKYEWVTRMKPAPLPAWLAALLAEPAHPQSDSANTDGKICAGQRNQHLASLAGSMRRRGMSQPAIEAALFAENKLRCDSPLPEVEVRKIAMSIARYQPTPDLAKATEESSQDLDRLAKLVSFAEIQPKALRWVWLNRIPAGKLSLLVGDPDKGKSLITLDMAAHITTGKSFPDGAPCSRGSVILLSAEDDAEDTIRPRLEVAGADLSRVHWLEAVRVVQKDGKHGERSFCLESDINALYDAIKQHPDVQMIVIDPISAYLGGTESQKNAEVRGLLAPLKAFTSGTGVTIVGITHFRKSNGPAIHRSIDSIAFAAAARAVWGVAPDPEDPDKRIMLRIKGNLSQDPGGLAYRIKVNSGLPCIAWEPGAVNLRADDVMGGIDSREDSSERNEAAQWLREFLADGPQPVREVQKQADKAGFSWATVRRAKATMSICKQQTGFHGGWQWSLSEAEHPSGLTDAQPPSCTDAQAQSAKVSNCGDTRINKGEDAGTPHTDAQPAQASNCGGEGSELTLTEDQETI